MPKTQHKRKVFITGATGLLGTALLLSKPKDTKIVGNINIYDKTLSLKDVDYVDLDIKEDKQVEKLISKIKPDVIIHTAAHGRVDFCENNKEEAFATNVVGTRNILSSAKKVGAKVIFCSTNMTYDGLKPPYDEKSPQNPHTYYGETKVVSEKDVMESGVNYTIVRLMTMYGWNLQPSRKNMISMAIEKLSQGEKLWMTNDIWNNLLLVDQAAEFFWEVIDNPQVTDRQLFNIAGKECINRYQATIELCEVFGFDKNLVTEVSSEYFSGQETPRSPNTCYNTTKAEEKMNFEPLSMQAGLGIMKDNPLPQV